MMNSHTTFAKPPCYNKSNTNSYREIPQKQEDTERVASFLLSLKHRSVTPDPHHSGDDCDHGKAMRVPDRSYSSYNSCSYDPSYTDRAPPSGCADVDNGNNKPPVLPQASETASESSDFPWEALIAGNKLVMMKDRDLVPDALFVAMAQMKPCRLTQADRVGCYKTREIGFVGMSCKHCGGQPGFGRYYPNSVRSLAQTTTSQTILKHVGSKCRFCPQHIRNAVLELQRQQAAREGLAAGRPRYGSRKIFFQRVWSRLHGTSSSFDEEEGGNDHHHHPHSQHSHSSQHNYSSSKERMMMAASNGGDESSAQTPSDLDEETSTASGVTAEEEIDTTSCVGTLKRKQQQQQQQHRFGAPLLPTQRNKRPKISTASEHPLQELAE